MRGGIFGEYLAGTGVFGGGSNPGGAYNGAINGFRMWTQVKKTTKVRQVSDRAVSVDSLANYAMT